MEPRGLCKWFRQTSAWVVGEASDGRVLVSVTRAGLLPDRRSRVLAVSQRAWVGATSAEARLGWPSLRIWLCSHARPEPIGSVVPRAVMVVVSSRPKTWAAKTRRAGQAGCADPSLGGGLWSRAGRACRLGAPRDLQTDPFMMSCWLALGNVCRGIDVAGAVATASGQRSISKCVLWYEIITKSWARARAASPLRGVHGLGCGKQRRG